MMVSMRTFLLCHERESFPERDEPQKKRHHLSRLLRLREQSSPVLQGEVIQLCVGASFLWGTTFKDRFERASGDQSGQSTLDVLVLMV
ncbi:hypothetical protein KSF_087240 [Reticulibacter mediterranei]|uniref:Uncharacterized protein n=1 Tax=Reticulibacter mediterranei TaxID=2778369 RepID=A0A8J3J0N4_9CHLR|nr:hypothetical protein KSF_087240 [Reticulibacter mediterranei]